MARAARKRKREADLTLDKVKRPGAALREEQAMRDSLRKAQHYSPEQFGLGRKNGGAAEFVRKRKEALARLFAQGRPPTPEESNRWHFFVENWDRVMAQKHDTLWGQVFAEMVNWIVQELRDNQNACYTFMSQQWGHFSDLQHVLL